MKIHDRIYVIGGGDNSFGLSNALDCTVYFVDGGSEGAIIDAGCGLESGRILDNLRSDGFFPGYVSKILLTHAHADHCGGAACLSECCDAAIYAGKQSADFLKNHDLDAISVKPAMESGIYPADYVFPFCNPVGMMDGEVITVGDLRLTVLDLPGHSDGHVGFYWEYGGKRLLFSGDLVFGKARISLQKTWDCRLQPYLNSLRRVDALKIDTLLTGHQAFILNGAYRVLERVLSSDCSLPKNL